jgi:hypothetical protein
MKIDSGVEALQELGAKNIQSAQVMESGVQALQEKTDEIGEAIEQAKLCTPPRRQCLRRRVVILTAPICRRTLSKDL